MWGFFVLRPDDLAKCICRALKGFKTAHTSPSPYVLEWRSYCLHAMWKDMRTLCFSFPARAASCTLPGPLLLTTAEPSIVYVVWTAYSANFQPFPSPVVNPSREDKQSQFLPAINFRSIRTNRLDGFEPSLTVNACTQEKTYRYEPIARSLDLEHNSHYLFYFQF